MRIDNLHRNFLKRFNLIKESAIAEEQNYSSIDKSKDTDNLVISYTAKEVRQKAQSEGPESLINEMKFILDELLKKPEDIDIKKLTKTYLSIHNMDELTKYMMEFLAQRGVASGSQLYKFVRNFFYTEEGRALMLSLKNALDQNENNSKPKNISLIDYSQYCKDEIIEVTDVFATISEESPFNSEQLVALYSLPTFKSGMSVGNAELMMLFTGASCRIDGAGDIKIGNDINIEVKAPGSAAKSSIGRFGYGSNKFRDSSGIIKFTQDKCKEIISNIINAYKIDDRLKDTLVAKYLGGTEYRLGRVQNSSNAYKSFENSIYEICDIIYRSGDVKSNESEFSSQVKELIKSGLGDIYSTAWTYESNDMARDIFEEHFNKELSFSGSIINRPADFIINFEDFINRLGALYAAEYFSASSANYIMIFNGHLDASAKLLVVPVNYLAKMAKTVGSDRRLKFVLPSMYGNAGRRAHWGFYTV